MSGDKLTPLQWHILRALASLEPRFTLTGGGALAGIHLKHRTTRDLDLFWRNRKELGVLPRLAVERLEAAGVAAEVLQSAPSFHRIRASEGGEACIVELVAEPFPAVEDPQTADLGGASIAVDTPHEILVNKLCALLGRSELRDLVDIRALLEAGADLERAIADAPRKDAGFSLLTLAWVLKDLDVPAMTRALGWDPRDAKGIAEFHRAFLDKIVSAAAPE